MREYSIPALADIPATCTLADVVSRRAAEQPQATALRRKRADGTWEDVTTTQFRDEVSALAKGLIAAGIDAGDRVALMSHTRYEWTLVDYAAWAAGAVVVPIYENLVRRAGRVDPLRLGRQGGHRGDRGLREDDHRRA